MAEENEIQPYVIGLDMGGTNSVFGVVDQRGTIKAQTVIKTKAYPDVHDYVNAAVEALQPAFDLIGGKENIKGMGIGAPNGTQAASSMQPICFGKILFRLPHCLKMLLIFLYA